MPGWVDPQWLDPVNAWAAIPLQVVGFAVALWQINKARTAAEAAKAAADATADRVGQNLLLVVLPQLNQVETNLEWAIGRDDRDAALHYLGSWRWQAGQARGWLSRAGAVSEEILTEIQASIGAAADAKIALQDPGADVRKRCRAVQKAIAVVTGTVGELSATHSLKGTSSDGDH